MKNSIQTYHETRTVLDTKYIDSIFDRQEREVLKDLQVKVPSCVIRMANADLIAAGYIPGIGGSVPATSSGLIYNN